MLIYFYSNLIILHWKFSGSNSSLKETRPKELKRSPDQFLPSARRSKVGIPENQEDYETSLTNLWGEDTLRLLRDYVRAGDIENHHIQTMAAKMGVKRICSENCHKVNLVETFERMLEEWFNQNLFDFQPSEAKDKLVKVLKDSRFDKIFVTDIQKLCDKNWSSWNWKL